MPILAAFRPSRAAVRVLASGALAASLLIAGSPARAADVCEGDILTAPDGRIRLDADGDFVGAGQYPDSSVVAKLAVGEEATFTLRWVNVSDQARTIRVNLLGQLRDPGYSVKYHLKGENVTPRIRAGKSLKIADVPVRRTTKKLVVTIRNKSGDETSSVLLRLAGRYGGSDPLLCDELRPGANLA